MHCTLQYTIDTKKYSIKLFNSSYVWSICSQKMTFSTRKSGIPPEISRILFFKFEFTFRSENAVFGGISSGIPFPVIAGILKKNKKVNPVTDWPIANSKSPVEKGGAGLRTYPNDSRRVDEVRHAVNDASNLPYQHRPCMMGLCLVWSVVQVA